MPTKPNNAAALSSADDAHRSPAPSRKSILPLLGSSSAHSPFPKSPKAAKKLRDALKTSEVESLQLGLDDMAMTRTTSARVVHQKLREL